MPIFGLCVRGQVRMLSKAWDYSSSDRVLHCLPLHHILHHPRDFCTVVMESTLVFKVFSKVKKVPSSLTA
jgi:hypothetical protein